MIVGITESGVTGWGEAAPYPDVTPESVDDVWDTLCDLGLAVLEDSGSRIPPTAAAGIDQAREDLSARQAGLSIRSFSGDADRPVRACAAIGLESLPAQTVDRVGEAINAGIRQVKVKIEPGRDLDHLWGIRSRYPDLSLAADANGSYRIGDQFFESVDSLGLTYLEQPLPVGDRTGYSMLREQIATLVCLDESTATAADAQAAIDQGIADIVSLKPGLLGVTSVRYLAEHAEKAGITVKIGGLVETSVGRAHALALAAHPAVKFTDLVPPRWLLDGDVSNQQWELVNGHLSLPRGSSGIGVNPMVGARARYVVRSEQITA